MLAYIARTLVRQPWTSQDQGQVNLFLHVAIRSNELWFDPGSAFALAPGSDVIIADGVGALYGGLLGPVGFIIYGTLFSLAVNEGALALSPPVPATGTDYCPGDGTGTACPCGNLGAAGNGCANSVNPNGGHLTASGFASIAYDTMVLQGSGMPNSSALYFQGTSRVAATFGDGLRCAGGSIIRLSTKTNVAGTSTYPGSGDLPISVRGATSAGVTRTYQAWYRNAASFCTPSTFNLTNGFEVTWAP